jgi:hypothetical protein
MSTSSTSAPHTPARPDSALVKSFWGHQRLHFWQPVALVLSVLFAVVGSISSAAAGTASHSVSPAISSTMTRSAAAPCGYDQPATVVVAPSLELRPCAHVATMTGWLPSSAQRRLARFVAAEGGAFTADDLGTVREYLSSQGFLDDPANNAMVDRIQSAIDSGRPLTEGEQNFMTHELTEANLVNDGMSQEAAHEIASGTHPPFSNYDPAVISQYPDLFNENWFHYWEGR